MTWCARFLASCLPYGGAGRINCKQRWLDGGHACQDASRVETDGPLDKTLQTAGGGGVEAEKTLCFRQYSISQISDFAKWFHLLNLDHSDTFISKPIPTVLWSDCTG